MKKRKSIKQAYQESKRSSLVVYAVLRVLVIVCMILQILKGNFENALLCLLSLFLLLVPFFIQKNFKITLPNTLEIIILLFIFSAEILGEIQNFYGIFPFWDTMLHTINGFLAAAVGFSLINLLNKNSEKFNLSPVYLCLVAFCFSMTIGVLWEFFEFASDKVLNIDMQKDRVVDKISSVELDPEKNNNPVVIKDIGYTIIYDKEGKELAKISNGYLDIGINDTMKDLIVNFIGAVVFSSLGYFYLISNGKNTFVTNFVPQKGSRKVFPKTLKTLTKEK
ncbi:MAG: hypothetical protein ACI4PE_02270 [Bacilli bacterium]